MLIPNSISDSRGSRWHRWDPHIHTPGTLLNDQYGGQGAWSDFLDRLEESQPAIAALGITDYLSTKIYEDVLNYRDQGRLANVGLVFPNVEMRFGIETNKSSGVNVHLLFSPDDPKHVEEINRFLQRLEFRFKGDSYHCCKNDLIRLGHQYNPSLTTDESALAAGVNQFKVTFEQLQDEWHKSEWVRMNCLVAVAAGERDGTSGLRDLNDSFAALRKSIEAFAHIIFSANPAQVEFWLGRRGATVENLEATWGGMKPCLHGSDAHQLNRVGAPDEDRFCWIKGDVTFESLRYACIEPEGRVHIGPEPPRGALAGNVVQTLKVTYAPWMEPSTIPLNSGLVAVIGARGSGKTALADLIAAGGLEVGASLNPRSFVVRARDFLTESRSELLWESGETTGNNLLQPDPEALSDVPRVQYLSQQFVEDLCSSEGLADSLLREIERVIFNAHPIDERDDASDFSELYSLRSAAAIESRCRNEQELESVADALLRERQLKQSLPTLRKQRDDLARQNDQDQKDRKGLIGTGQEARAKRHEELVGALTLRRRVLEAAKARLRALSALQEDVADFRKRRAPAWLDEIQTKRAEAAFKPSEWGLFNVNFVSDVDTFLRNSIASTTVECRQLMGTPAGPTSAKDTEDINLPLIDTDVNLGLVSVELLQREVSRIEKLIGIDSQNAKRFAALNEKITQATKAIEKINGQITVAQGADDRIQVLIQQRQEAYTGVFSAILKLELELSRLYSPLALRLRDSSGSLSKLGFAVRRHVDIEQWAVVGESLLDLRRNGPFKGRGALLEAATQQLFVPWRSGTPEDVSVAMQEFIRVNEAALRAHKPESQDSREWASAVSKWLHNTSHIQVSYGLQYDGVDVERLSPGTRGIVLLLLYLAIDEEDDRPLIIDQPEENLDPQSIFDELVGRFRSAKQRRQVIIVTHNANLVVNSDADQVIVATAGQHKPGELPKITYSCGGLENPVIRKRVCDVLEGGERAFKARARRLRLEINEASVRQVAVSSLP